MTSFGLASRLRMSGPNYLLTFGFLSKFLFKILLSLISSHASFISGFLKKQLQGILQLAYFVLLCKHKWYTWIWICLSPTRWIYNEEPYTFAYTLSLYRPTEFKPVEDPRFIDKVVSHKYKPLLPPGNIPGTQFCYRPSQLQDHSAVGRFMSMKYSKDTFGNRTRSIQAYSRVPQRTAPLAVFNNTWWEERESSARSETHAGT
jgi:hypothetical protein